MTSDRERHAAKKALFLAVEELAHGAREAYLRASGADPELLAEVREMLRAAADTGDLVDAFGAEVARTAAEQAREFSGPGSQGHGSAVPEHIGPYRIVARLGEGGMGIVYEAEQQSPHRRIALKVLHASTPGHLDRIEREAEALGRLQHEGIAHIYEAGRVDGPSGPRAYLAMELVRGVPLDRFARQRSLPDAARVALVASVADAVHAAHRQGVVHRDLKPDNVLVDEAGRTKVLDFGIAEFSAVGAVAPPTEGAAVPPVGPVVGTVAYMSPEQAAGAAGVDTAIDVWSLGVILFELLTGRRPHDLDGLSVPAALDRVRHTPPRRLRELRPDLPADLESAVVKALAADPAARYASCAALAADLHGWLQRRPVAAHPATWRYLLRTFARRNRTLVAGAFATLLALVLGIVMSTAFAWQAADQRDQARALSYRLAVRSALQEGERGRHAAAAAILEEAPHELRGFEWRHARARLESWWRDHALPATPVGQLCYLPDGKRVVTATKGGRILRIDLASGSVDEPFPGLDDYVGVAVHGDVNGGELAGATALGDVVVWSLAAPHASRRFDVGGGSSVLLAYAADGRLFALGRDRLLGWHGGEQRTIASFDAGKPFLSFAVAPDGAVAVGARDDEFVCWDTATGRATRAAEPKITRQIVVAGDGREMVATTVYQNLRLCSLPELRRLDRDQGHVRTTHGLARSADGAWLASTSPDGTLVTYDAATRQATGLATRGSGLAALAFRPDAGELVTADAQGARLCTWRLPLSPALELGSVGGNVERLLWTPDGELLFASTEAGTTCAFDAATGELLARARLVPFAIGDDGTRLLVRRDGVLQVWDLAAAGAFSPIAGSSSLEAFAQLHGCHTVSPYGWSHPDPVHRRYAISRHTRVEVGAHPRDPARIHFPLDVAGEVTAVRFDRRGERLVAGTRSGGLQIFECGTWRSRLVIQPRVATWILSLDWSPDGARLAAACHDNMVRLFDPVDGELLVELRGHRSHVAAVQWSLDGSRLASGSGDATVRIWDSVPQHERLALAAARVPTPRQMQRRATLRAWRD